MATWRDILFSALLLAAASIAAGSVVDQSQPVFEDVNDWMGGSAQGFRAGVDGRLTGIRLPLSAEGGGCDLTLDVKHVDDTGMPTGAVLASATLAESAFTANTTQWYLVEFPDPYVQTAGEDLAFVLRFGSPAPPPFGWLEMGFTTNDLYADGLFYYSGSYGPGGWVYTNGHIDLAFETLVSPELWADFDAEPVLGAAPLGVVFTATYRHTNASPPELYWDFDGDGVYDTNGLSLTTVTNTYVSNGTYSVLLMVTNSAGESRSVERPDLVEVLSPASHYVSLMGAHETPFDTEAKAATNIQAALDVAMDGALVQVMPGVYGGVGNANIDFHGKSVQLVSAAGPRRTVIAGQPSIPAFRFHSGESNDCVLSGFTIRECGALVSTADGWVVTNPASAVVCVSNSNPCVTNCIIVENRGRYGGGFFVRSSSPAISDCTISNNYAVLGGGVFAADASPTLSDCRIEENRSATFDGGTRDIAGGGVYACSNSFIFVTGGIVRANEGGGLYLVGSAALVENVLVLKNTRGGSSISIVDSGVGDEYRQEHHAGHGGGITCVSSAVEIVGCRLEGNVADYGGGILAASNSSLAIGGSTIASNCAFWVRRVLTIEDPEVRQVSEGLVGSGGGLYCTESAVSVSNCTFAANLSGNGGGIALVSNSWLSVETSSFTNNEAATSTVWRTLSLSDPDVRQFATFLYCAGEGGGVYA